jgi:hypothetical protein
MTYCLRKSALAGAMLFIFSNCLSASDKHTVPELKNVDEALINKIKQTGWLEQDCNIGRISMKQADFKECVIVDAALLPPLDPSKRDHFGKDYDPEKYLDCRLNKARSRGDQTCHIYKLRRNEPEPVWPYPDAPPVQWPEPPEKSVYYPGISREEYFKALCQSEAGEFIYETVENVEGVYQIRPRNPERGIEMRDPYVMEDPFGFDISEANRPGMFFLKKRGYGFFESSVNESYSEKKLLQLKSIYDDSFYDLSGRGSYFRYSGRVSTNFKEIKRTRVSNLKSDFGYIWRGIKRPHDRELGIAGGELAVLDLRSNRILGVKRGFVYSLKKNNDEVSWLTGVRCIGLGSDKSAEFNNFIFSVLKPKL